MGKVIIKEMNGHSGCKVYLCQENHKKYVRKISSCKEYNNRFAAQIQKQINFFSHVINTPKVYGSGYDGELLYCDMESIGGMPLHNFVSLNTIDDIIPYIDKVSVYLQNLPETKIDASKIIKSKVDSLRLVLPKKLHQYCEYCLDYDWQHISKSQNHGDLTFENILVYRGKIYFIDFLDSFFETKYIDYAKLLQDILLGWSWRNNASTPFIKNIYLYDKILEPLSTEEVEMTKRFLVLNLIRIVPYSNSMVLEFVDQRLKYISERVIIN